MDKWKKIGLTVGIGAGAIGVCHLINRSITENATSRNITADPHMYYYDWKLGKTAYIKEGAGSPVLLIHNISSESSSYEWKRIIKTLSNHHTVYALDLLGCGHSDKPNITYTTYMYTQLINDFILNIIRKRVDIVASNDSSTLALMSALSNPLAYDNIILINPQNIAAAGKGPVKKDIYRKRLLDIPVVGTLIYNMCVTRKYISGAFAAKNFYNKRFISSEWLEAFHETAHIGGASAKYVFASKNCGYTAVSLSKAISTLSKITIIDGRENPKATEIASQYQNLNPAITRKRIVNSKLMPQLEQPLELYKAIKSVIEE
jgi:pimeloyl-ACP methyl ester carboxylesterase